MMRATLGRLTVVFFCIAAAWGWAAPPLTTIQDKVYKADGTPFQGLLIVQWTSFEMPDGTNVGAHAVTVPIVNGVVRVQLVATVGSTPATTYQVKYNSDGKIQFEEVWNVPASTLPQRIAAVRIATSSGGSTLPPGEASAIAEADVTGLVDDLAVRPVKSPAFLPLRVVYTEATGALAAVIGNASDCVRVDGTAGPCGDAGSITFVDDETPSGAINGVNAVFMIAVAPNPVGSLMLFRNGVLQKQTVDYTVAENVITFAAGAIPRTGDTLAASYRVTPAS